MFWIIPSFKICGYMLHVDNILCVIMNCGQNQWIVPSLFTWLVWTLSTSLSAAQKGLAFCISFSFFLFLKVNNMNPGYFSLTANPMKQHQYLCFYIFPLEFGGIRDLHTQRNRRVLCEDCNNSSIETPVCPRLNIHGKHVYKLHPSKSICYISHAEHFTSN